jgi:tetratricopeptide (TPR) repeat protein
MRRTITLAVLACAIVVGGIAATPAPAAPTLDSLRLPNTIAAQQGHARFLVGVRLSESARLTVQIIDPRKDNATVQTTIDNAARPEGRSYLRIEAVDNQGFQLVPGPYILRIQGLGSNGEVGNQLQRGFRLRLNPPAGRFDAYTVPLWRVFRSQQRIPARVRGQFIAVVGPRGPVAQAGMRRGDVVTHIGGVAVDTPGSFATALRKMPAEKAVPVTYVRNGRSVDTQVTAKADWEPAPNYAASLTVATRREPRSLALAFARAKEHLDAERVSQARALYTAWPVGWRRSAPGQYLDAEMLAAAERWRPALGAYNRALVREKNVASIQLGRGIALLELGNPRRAIGALAAAERTDARDAEVAGYQAYAFLRARLTERAVAAGQRAVRLDQFFADGFIPLGIALLETDQRSPGVQMLRRGLILLDDADRAARLIVAYLNPTDP